MADHSHNTAHHICMEKEKLIVIEGHQIKRNMREAMAIEKRNNTLNRDNGLKLSNTWRPILNRLRSQDPTI